MFRGSSAKTSKVHVQELERKVKELEGTLEDERAKRSATEREEKINEIFSLLEIHQGEIKRIDEKIQNEIVE